MSLTEKPPNSHSLLCRPTSENVDLLERFIGGFISLLCRCTFFRSSRTASLETRCG